MWFRKTLDPLAPHVVGALLPYDENRRTAEAIAAGRGAMGFGLRYLSVSERPVPREQAERVLLYRTGSIALAGCVTDPFQCRDPGVRVRFDAVVYIEVPLCFLAGTVGVRQEASPAGAERWIDADEVAVQLALDLPSALRGYTLADLQTQFGLADLRTLLAAPAERLGLRVDQVSNYEACSPTVEQRLAREAEQRRLADMAQQTCTAAELQQKVAAQLDAGRRAVELGCADHRIEMARRARLEDQAAREYEATCERIAGERARVRLATEQAQTDLARQQARAASAQDRAKAMAQFREAIPGILERHLVGPLQTMAQDMRQDVSGANDQVVQAVGAFADGLAQTAQAAAGTAAQAVGAFADGLAQTAQAAAGTVAGATTGFVARMQALHGDMDRLTAMYVANGATFEELAPKARELGDAIGKSDMALHLLTALIQKTMPEIGEISPLVRELKEVLAEARKMPVGDGLKQNMADLLGADGRLTGLSPLVSLIVENVLASRFPAQAAEAHMIAVRARFLDELQALSRRQIDDGCAVPQMSIVLVDSRGAPMRQMPGSNTVAGMRGTGLADDPIRQADTFKIRIVSPVAGRLWVLAQGRCLDEVPRLLYPTLEMLAPGAPGPARIAADCEVWFPNLLGIDRPLQWDGVTGHYTDGRETIWALVWDEAQPRLLVSRAPGVPGGPHLPIHAVHLSSRDQAVPRWLDLNLLRAEPLPRVTSIAYRLVGNAG